MKQTKEKKGETWYKTTKVKNHGKNNRFLRPSLPPASFSIQPSLKCNRSTMIHVVGKRETNKRNEDF